MRVARGDDGTMGSDREENSIVKRDPMPQRLPAAPVSATDQGLLGLQGTAGNGAVIQMLRRAGHAWAQDQHQHSDGCGHQAEAAVVQRSVTHDVLKGPGHPLADATRSEMESRLGADFSDVRLHTDGAAKQSAAELGARAYTSGSHVVIGEGGGDKHTLAHELTHVIQQRQGSVSGADNGAGLRVSDPSDHFERAAESNARAVMSRPAPPSPSSDVRRSVVPEAPQAAAPVQRAVVVKGRMYSNAHQQAHEKDPAPLWKEIETFVQNEPAWRRTEFHTHQTAMKQQLVKWVDDQGVGEKNAVGGPSKHHQVYGRKIRNHSFPEVGQLYASLLGWVRQKPGRHREKELAQYVKSNDEIGVGLDALLAKVLSWITGLANQPLQPGRYQQIIEELQTGLVNQKEYGTYRTHFDITAAAVNPAAKTGINGNMLAVLKHPEKHDMRDKIVVLHDVMEYFLAARHGTQTAGSNILAAPAKEGKVGTSKITPDGRRAEAVFSKGMHVDRGVGFITRDEKDPTTALARANNVPVWVGQSETTSRIMNFGSAAGANPVELSAAAWALFAFWRLDYDHTVTWGYHTLHEVLDMAHNFGVAYNVLDREQGLQDFAPGSLFRFLDSWQTHLAGELNRLQAPIADHDKRASAAGTRILTGSLWNLRQEVAALNLASAKVRSAEQAGRREERQAALREYALLCQQAIKLYQHTCAALAAAPPPAAAAAPVSQH
ncbi:DUF4157 domain-containing protein [Streptomyces sp. NPDC090741]|uniref:eCIS core domain-containing protein n=1 Tax=Streptomyces sp. NPDC090741 TaxID=3365967 RepID=UPI003816AA8A